LIGLYAGGCQLRKNDPPVSNLLGYVGGFEGRNHIMSGEMPSGRCAPHIYPIGVRDEQPSIQPLESMLHKRYSECKVAGQENGGIRSRITHLS
jgi:hypothetical protein